MLLDYIFVFDDVKVYGIVCMVIFGVYFKGEGCYG